MITYNDYEEWDEARGVAYPYAQHDAYTSISYGQPVATWNNETGEGAIEVQRIIYNGKANPPIDKIR